MKLTNIFKNKHGKPELPKVKNLNNQNISLVNTKYKINNLQQLEYKKKNRKFLRINFRNSGLAGLLIGINKN
jgi:hypothetical protein